MNLIINSEILIKSLNIEFDIESIALNIKD